MGVHREGAIYYWPRGRTAHKPTDDSADINQVRWPKCGWKRPRTTSGQNLKHYMPFLCYQASRTVVREVYFARHVFFLYFFQLRVISELPRPITAKLLSPHDRNLCQFYKLTPKNSWSALRKNGAKTCKISDNFTQPPTLIANISGMARDIQQESSAKLTNQRVSYAFTPSPFSFHACHILPAFKFQYNYSCILLIFYRHQ